jgi:hypothetical protein
MSANEPFYSSDVAKVYYDETLDTLFLYYLSRPKNSDQFIEINKAVLGAFKKLDTQKFVADIRRMGVISVDSQQWVVDNLFPGMLQHLKGKRLYHAQFLDPSEIFSKVSGSNVKSKSSKINEGMYFEQFSDQESLEKFLKDIK